MKRFWKYLLFFLLCLAVALVINLPIGQVLPHLKIPPTVGLADVSGTVFGGRVRQITVNQFPLRDVRYRLQPSCIALLKACYQIEYEQGSTRVGYDLINGITEVDQTRVEYAAAELSAYMPKMMVQPDGRLELTVEQMTIIEGVTAAAKGKLLWRDLGVSAEGTSLNLGDYQIEFSGDLQQYDFRLSDIDSGLDVDGKGDISADGQYSVDVRIASEVTIDPQVKSVLDLVASQVSYNNYRIEQNGRLPPNISRLLFK